MRVFVTGATGVLGRRVVPLLVSAGHEVSAVGRTPAKRAALEDAGARAVDLDLFAPVDVLAQSLANHDAVINLATHIPPTSRMFLPSAWKENDRIRGTAAPNLVQAAQLAGVERFIQESFAPMYAPSADRWIDESSPIQPARYNRTTAQAEAATARFTESGKTGIVLRFAFFYGPDSGQTRDIVAFVRRGWAPIPGAPDSYFPSVHLDDAASAVLAVLNAPAGVYNVVDDEPLPHSAHFNALARALEVAPPRFPPPWLTPLFGSLGETLARSLRVSNRKLRDQRGWVPRFPSAREGWSAVVTAVEA